MALVIKERKLREREWNTRKRESLSPFIVQLREFEDASNVVSASAFYSCMWVAEETSHVRYPLTLKLNSA